MSARASIIPQGEHLLHLVALDEAPSVDVNDKTPLASLAAKEVEAADHLAKGLADPLGITFLVVRELSNETDLLAIRVAAD